MTQGHLGLLMLSLVVVAIMLGFPTAFTLMGMGVLFAWLAYRWQNPDLAVQQTLDLMVQRTYATMTNDVLIAVPLFVFMGYMVERANLIEKLFKSLHLSMSFIPGSLAVATLATCALFATATGIVGAVVTLMGLLAFPAMLRSGYDIKLSAGVITAGGCLGILIPPSVMLILYGATAGVSVVQLYAGAFFPGLMLAGLYIAYVIVVAKLQAAPRADAARVGAARRPCRANALAVAGGKHRRALPRLVAALVRPAPGGAAARRGSPGSSRSPRCPAIFGAVALLRRLRGGDTATSCIDTGGLRGDRGDGRRRRTRSRTRASRSRRRRRRARAAGARSRPASRRCGVQEPPGAEAPPDGLAEPPGAAAPRTGSPSHPAPRRPARR